MASRTAHLTLATTLLLAALTSAAQAPTYPDRPIRLVVGFPPGGGVDLLARHLAASVAARLSARIVVENRPGAGGNVALQEVARAPADGYTLLQANVGQLAINPALYSSLTVDTVRAFAPVGLAASVGLALTVPGSQPASSVQELVAAAKAAPEPLPYGSGGAGGISHLGVERFAQAAGIKLLHVPFKGSAPAIAALLAGDVQLMIDGTALMLPHVAAGKLKVLAVTGRGRFPGLPAVPTLVESGFPDLVVQGWQGWVAPAGTPPIVVAKLTTALKEVLESAATREWLARQAIEPTYRPPSEFASMIAAERERWGALARSTGAKVD